MDQNRKARIERYLNQILAATDNIKSVGAQATMDNAGQLMGIRKAAMEVWRLVDQPEPTEMAREGSSEEVDKHG